MIPRVCARLCRIGLASFYHVQNLAANELFATGLSIHFDSSVEGAYSIRDETTVARAPESSRRRTTASVLQLARRGGDVPRRHLQCGKLFGCADANQTRQIRRSQSQSS